MTKDELSQLDPDTTLLIDIREADEVAAAPAPLGGVTHMPMGKVFVEAYKGNISQDQKIISLCQTGGRCKVLTGYLTERGYQADYLEGGLLALNEAAA